MSSIKEQRQQMLKEKIKEMGNIGVKVRPPEESPFYDPPIDYEKECERMQIPSSESTKRVSSNDVPLDKEPNTEIVPELIPASDEDAPGKEATATRATEHKPQRKEVRQGMPPNSLSFEEYGERFLILSRLSGGKSGFTINSELLQMLKGVLRDVRAKTTLTAYIENILLEHLRDNQAMLNKAAAQQKKNQTLNL